MPDLNIFLLQCRASYLRRLSMLLTTEHSFKSCWGEVLEMLAHERRNDKRAAVLQRLHQRYNTLRVARERIELLQEATKP